MTLTLKDYAEAKKLDPAFLASLGVSDHHDSRGAYMRIPYMNEAGEEAAVRHRLALEGPARFCWRTRSKPLLYGLNRLADARREGYVLLVEGESDCHTLWQEGIPALGLPGVTTWNEKRDAAHFDGIARIYVVVEDEKGAAAIERWLAVSAIRDRAHLVRMGEPLKDPSALFADNPARFKKNLDALLARAETWAAHAARRDADDEKTAYARCEALANHGDILQTFLDNLGHEGLVGENRNAAVLYLALTSRLLKKPVSLAYKGVSSCGKSYAIDRVLRHFPDDAVVNFSSMSERALLYDADDYAHRHLIFAEADGMSEFQDYLIRTLLSEGRLEHRMVDKTETGALVGRRIVKDGPTGLILTTTKVQLHPENETRLISLQANDTQEQTRAVLDAVARRDEPLPAAAAEWRALQTWLRHGERRVKVPFARVLASLVSAAAVRMRRDFGAVLSLVEAHALLHRATRTRDQDGRIVATLADYAAVRALVCDLIAEAVAQTVPKEMRETVEAVRALAGDHGVGVNAIAGRLNLDHSAAARRCRRAKQAGYVVNEETRRGQDARYKPGNPMPKDADALPSLAALERALSGQPAEEGGGGSSTNPADSRATLPRARQQGMANGQAGGRPPSTPPQPHANGEGAARWSVTI